MSLRRDEVTPRWKRAKPRPCSLPLCREDALCVRCRGKANQANGRKAQDRVAKTLGIRNRFRSARGAEENWRHLFRVEVKSGAQVEPAFTPFLGAEDQSTKKKSEGDARPFCAVFMPKDATDGLVLMRLSTFRREIAPLLEP